MEISDAQIQRFIDLYKKIQEDSNKGRSLSKSIKPDPVFNSQLFHLKFLPMVIG